jgi:hypothetical protein
MGQDDITHMEVLSPVTIVLRADRQHLERFQCQDTLRRLARLRLYPESWLWDRLTLVCILNKQNCGVGLSDLSPETMQKHAAEIQGSTLYRGAR